MDVVESHLAFRFIECEWNISFNNKGANVKAYIKENLGII